MKRNTTQHAISLIDILIPPANQWLREISRRKRNLPVGVRVVRFSGEDDEDFDKPGELTTSAEHQSG